MWLTLLEYKVITINNLFCLASKYSSLFQKCFMQNFDEFGFCENMIKLVICDGYKVQKTPSTLMITWPNF